MIRGCFRSHRTFFRSFFFLFLSCSCESLRYKAVEWFTPAYKNPGDPEKGETPLFLGKDIERPKIPVRLLEVANGFPNVTDLQFPPPLGTSMLVSLQTGELYHYDLTKKILRKLLKLPVVTTSELGLLGVTFHPRFPTAPCLYLHWNEERDGKPYTVIGEWILSLPDWEKGELLFSREILTLPQPYPNHNGGQILFGPDGYLYIGLGDGGYRGDPHNYGQNRSVLYGKILRISVECGKKGDPPYTIPPDNPFAGEKGYRGEIYAFGFRNPWRFSWDLYGRVLVADVGQDLWEEVDIVEPGGNYGWRIREGAHCYSPKENCPAEGLIDPVYEYGHEEGQSITGGYLYLSQEIPQLYGLYIFGDFVQGKIWALSLPREKGEKVTVYALGKFPYLISTFGRDREGRVYVGDYGKGGIYRIAPQ